MPNEKRGSEEPGDQILDRPADRSDGDASSKDQGRTLDAQADVAGGRFFEPEDEEEAENDEDHDQAE